MLTKIILGLFVPRKVAGYTRRDGVIVHPYTRQYWVTREVEVAVERGTPDFPQAQRQIVRIERKKKLRREARRKRIEEKITEREVLVGGGGDDQEAGGVAGVQPPPTIEESGVLQFGSSQWVPFDKYRALFEQAMLSDITIQDPIYRMEKGSVFVSLHDGLVWEYPLKARQEDLIGMERLGVVRIWALLFRSDTEELFVIARARSLRLAPGRQDTIAYAEKIASEMYTALLANIETWESNSSSYVFAHGRLCWTFWYGAEKAPSRFPPHLEGEKLGG